LWAPGFRKSTLDFAMQRVPLEVRIELLLFNPALLQLFVAAAHVAGNRLVLGTGFGAFQNDVFSGHGIGIELNGRRYRWPPLRSKRNFG
jgi:hypothetical protein